MRRPAIRGWARSAIPIAGALVAATLLAGVVVASDHQDTPFVEFNPRYDVNDVYAFPSPTAGRTVLVLGTSSPLTPASTPTARFGTRDEVLYQLKIDNTGDGVEDLVIQATFENRPNEQRVSVVGPTRPNGTGTANTLVLSSPRVTVGRTDRVLTGPNGVQVFAGPRDDPFFIDLEQFFRVLPDRRPARGPLSMLPSTPTATSFRAPGEAIDFVRGINDLAIVVEVPTAMLTDNGSRPRFGVWGTTSRLRGRVD